MKIGTLRIAYNNALKQGLTMFVIIDQEQEFRFVTSYAKYVLEYLDMQTDTTDDVEFYFQQARAD